MEFVEVLMFGIEFVYGDFDERLNCVEKLGLCRRW